MIQKNLSQFSTDEVGSSLSGGEQDFRFLAVPDGCRLGHNCCSRSCIYYNLQNHAEKEDSQ